MDERVPVHVGSVLEDTLELLTASLPPAVRLERQVKAADTVFVGNAMGVHQVARNLCTNAVHAMGRKGVLTVVLDRVEVAERHSVSQGILSIGSYVRLLVTDTGSGIPQEVLERMFDPFFTTKRTGEGTGLGLSLVHGIVADFGGAIDVVTQVGAGTTFTIWLPATNAAGPPRGIGEAVVTMPVSDCFD
jgi:signal transduction histidine kinase